MPQYYKNWDKFDVNKALDEVSGSEDEEEDVQVKQRMQQKPKTQEEMLKLTSGAAPNTKIVVKGGTIKYSSQAE